MSRLLLDMLDMSTYRLAPAPPARSEDGFRPRVRRNVSVDLRSYSTAPARSFLAGQEAVPAPPSSAGSPIRLL